MFFIIVLEFPHPTVGYAGSSVEKNIVGEVNAGLVPLRKGWILEGEPAVDNGKDPREC